MGSLSEYELQRLENIKRNKGVLDSLGLGETEKSKHPRRPRSSEWPSEPTRVSEREKKAPSSYDESIDRYEKEIQDKKREQRRRALEAKQKGVKALKTEYRLEARKQIRGRRPVPLSWLPLVDDDLRFPRCGKHARVRHKFSKTKSFSDIDKTIYEETMKKLPGEKMEFKNGKYSYVWYEKKSETFRAHGGQAGLNLGTYCEPEMAAFVSNYWRVNQTLTEEEVWKNLGIIDIEDTLEPDKKTKMKEQHKKLEAPKADAASDLVEADRSALGPALPALGPALPALPALGPALGPALRPMSPSADDEAWADQVLVVGRDDGEHEGEEEDEEAEEDASGMISVSIADLRDFAFEEIVCSYCGVLISSGSDDIVPNIGCVINTCPDLVCYSCAGFVTHEGLASKKWACYEHRRMIARSELISKPREK